MKATHRGWFELGSRTLREVLVKRGREHALPDDGDWYLCPLCIDVIFMIDDFVASELTVEHVPPKSLGGKEMVLTCKRCNNVTGSKFDAEASKRERLMRFLSGESSKSEIVTLTMGEHVTRMETNFSSSGVYMSGIPKMNNPRDVDGQVSFLREITESNVEEFFFTMAPKLKYHPERAQISWTRSAYLAAFAVFGWSYILHPALEPFRTQFANPDKITLPLRATYSPDADPARYEVFLVKQPVEHRSIFVMMGKYGAFLPYLDDKRTFEQIAADLGAMQGKQPVAVNFKGSIVPWPAGPQHLLDLASA